MAGWHSAKGFTMIELIIVMLVAAVLSAIAMPRLTDRSRREAVRDGRNVLAPRPQQAWSQWRDRSGFAAPRAR